MKKRLIAVLAAACTLCVSVIPPLQAFAAPEVIHISTVEELKTFANNCRLDAFSNGLKVILDNDLNLGGVPFEPIPTFMGTFEGNNHTIKGFVCANDGSNQGFFRYVEESGVVMNLNVEGEVTPEVGKVNIGGIVGTNYGRVEFCTFDGNVDGLINTGGVVGYNKGTIVACGMKGSVVGKQYTGGICGYNEGSVAGCSNEASVNIEIQTATVDFSKLSLLELVDLDTITLSDSDIVSDSGGIVGGSSEVVKDCTNRGTVGYQHYGYNVGGIAGRQSGFLTGCVNYGEVYGRKDVAGICGQMEPYLLLQDSESLVDELQALNDSISVAMDDLQGDASAMKGQLESLKGNTSNATSAASDYDEVVKKLYEEKLSEIGKKDENEDTTTSDKVNEIKTDVGNVTDGVDQNTKDDIAAGNMNQDDLDDIKDSINQNGGNTGDSIGQAEDRLDQDIGNVSDDTINNIQNGEVNRDDLSNIGEAVGDSAAGEAAKAEYEKIIAQKEAEAEAEAIKQAEREAAITQAQQVLNEKVNTIGSALANLNDNLADITGRFAANLSAVNKQFEKVNRLMTRILVGDMTYYEDISVLDTEDDVNGKVSYCTNYGYVNADENVGGVAGEMAIEVELDKEEALVGNNLAINGIVSKMYESRAVIRSCSNEAPISARKSNVGGIVGKNGVGIVFYCQNYGDIKGESRNVGGIAGSADNWVMGSYSMCNLSGESYIGGIVGNGAQVTDSLSMVSIADEHSACNGAIAGYLDVTKENAALNNYYISESLGAIDGISYAGKAEPITAEELYQKESIPEEFRSMVVTFVADGVTTKIVKVAYGQAFPADQTPEVPEKEGYVGEWQTFDGSSITGCMTVEATYYPVQNSMDTPQTRPENGLPIMLVEGDYEGNASVKVSQYQGETAEVPKGKEIEKLTMVISGENTTAGEETETYQVRYLAPHKKTRVKLYEIAGDGSLSEIAFETKGSYLAFEVPSKEFNFVCADLGKNYIPWVIGFGALAVVIVLIAIWIAKHFIKKPHVKKEEE